MALLARLMIALTLLTASASAGEITDLRDKRYCEVFLGVGGIVVPKQIDVYNTIQLNDCPEDLWAKLAVDTLKAEIGARFVKLNGPRHWTIDGMTNTHLVSTEVRAFGGIDMRLAGILKLSLEDMLSPPKAYQKHTVDRHTTWVYLAGEPVYQIVDDMGAVYFMQSYSLEKDASQNIATLPQLGAKLSLPPGWIYRTVVLEADFNLVAAESVATIIQDDLLNTYQLAPGLKAETP
jgi:hypothetical protein